MMNIDRPPTKWVRRARWILRAQGLDRVSLFAALRRMVGDGPGRRQHPDQFLEAGPPSTLDLALARSLVAETWDSSRRWSYLNQAQWARIQTLHARVVQLLQQESYWGTSNRYVWNATMASKDRVQGERTP